MKNIVLVILFFAAGSFTSFADLIRFRSPNIEAGWKKTSPKVLEEVEKKIFAAGVSSTGQITVSGIYTLSHNEDIGSEGDTVALVTQEDLHGSRLFSLHLVNLDSAKIIEIYETGK